MEVNVTRSTGPLSVGLWSPVLQLTAEAARTWLSFLPASQWTHLKLSQLLAIVEDPEGIQVVGAGIRKHFTAHQAEGLLGHLAPVPVLVEVQVAVSHEAPA